MLRHLDHLYVVERATNEEFTRGGQGNAKIRQVEHRAHGLAMRDQLHLVLSTTDAQRREQCVAIEELKALGTIIVLEGADAAHPLKVDSLNRLSTHRSNAKRPMWLLLSVQPPTDAQPERATVWVSDAYRDNFLQLFQDYLSQLNTSGNPANWTTPEGNPANQALISNISRIREAVLVDLWTSDGEPPSLGTHWWELWLDTSQPALGVFDAFATAQQLRTVRRAVSFRDRHVVWVQASWDQLQILLFSRVPIAEIRRPEFIDTIDDLPADEKGEYVQDLADRILTAESPASPAVCHLDTGVFQGHALLRGSLNPADVHSIIGTSGHDVHGHGTAMAGLALLGGLDPLLTGTQKVQLEHRLESVRMKPARGESLLDPLDYGTATADAVTLPEIAAARPRVFCMPLSAEPDKPGEPTLWSSTVDALAVGTDIVRDGRQLRLLSSPDPAAARLIVIAAGNVDTYQHDHRAESDTSAIQDPAQAWNALTVSAYTDLDNTPTDPDYDGWRPQARAGELSPHSRTSMLFAGRKWPIKPDICMEGGNVLTDGGTGFEPKHALLSLRTTGIANDLALAPANATSAATAQASRLAAMTMARYPSYWPETIRGLLTHAAEWTPSMRQEIQDETGKVARLRLLRRYGWGVPTEEAVLHSSQQSVTMVSQDTFVPFDGPKYQMRHFRLHPLPWPREALEGIGDDEVRMRVTLTYFIEPSPSRRGWRQRYSYPSHGLRFDLQSPLESQREFVRRVNHDAQRDEEGAARSTSASERWFIGPNQRHLGSLHQDEWTGTGHELAAANTIAVYPVGGWWKNTGRPDRTSVPVRYGLLVSLRTRRQDIDLYTPIATQLRVPTAVVTQQA